MQLAHSQPSFRVPGIEARCLSRIEVPDTPMVLVLAVDSASCRRSRDCVHARPACHYDIPTFIADVVTVVWPEMSLIQYCIQVRLVNGYCGWMALQATEFISRPLSALGHLVTSKLGLEGGDWLEREMWVQNGCK